MARDSKLMTPSDKLKIQFGTLAMGFLWGSPAKGARSRTSPGNGAGPYCSSSLRNSVCSRGGNSGSVAKNVFRSCAILCMTIRRNAISAA